MTSIAASAGGREHQTTEKRRSRRNADEKREREWSSVAEPLFGIEPEPVEGTQSERARQLLSQLYDELDLIVAASGKSYIYENSYAVDQSFGAEYGNRTLLELVQNATVWAGPSQTLPRRAAAGRFSPVHPRRRAGAPSRPARSRRFVRQ
jgi:hypothetical protein